MTAFGIAYSRGFGRFDNTPKQKLAPDFAEFCEAVLADRGEEKGQQWIAAAFANAPDDERHRSGAAKQDAIGKPHRCAACVLPRAFIGLDVDGGLTSESFSALVQVCHRWSGLVYTTASHTPTAPRCRIIVELDEAAARPDLIAASVALREIVAREMADAGQPAPEWDEACDRPEQPLYLPVTTSEAYRLDGEPARLADLLASRSIPDSEGQALNHCAGEFGIEGVVVEFDRHADVLKLAANLARNGVARDSALATFRSERDRGRYTRDVPDREFLEAFDGACGKYRTGTWDAPPVCASSGRDTEEPMLLVSVGDLRDARSDPPQFVVNPIIPRGEVTLLSGHGGSGKSTLALVLAAHVATGRQWGPFQFEQAGVLFVTLEDPSKIVRFRLSRIAEAYGLPTDMLHENLKIADGTITDASLAVEQSEYGDRALVPTAAYAQLEKITDTYGLIVIDNASDGFEGNSNDARMVRAFVRKMLARLARDRNCGVLLLAHIDKAAARYGSNGQSFIGSTAWHNSARSRLALIPKDGTLSLEHEKANLSQRSEPIALRWNDVGIPVPVGMDLSDAEQAAADLVFSADVEAVLAALVRAKAADAVVYPNSFGNSTAQKGLEAFGLPDSLKGKRGRDRFWTAMNYLIGNGRAIVVDFRTAGRKKKKRIVAKIESNAPHAASAPHPHTPAHPARECGALPACAPHAPNDEARKRRTCGVRRTRLATVGARRWGKRRPNRTRPESAEPERAQGMLARSVIEAAAQSREGRPE